MIQPDPDLLERARRVAQERGVTFQELVRQALEPEVAATWHPSTLRELLDGEWPPGAGRAPVPTISATPRAPRPASASAHPSRSPRPGRGGPLGGGVLTRCSWVVESRTCSSPVRRADRLRPLAQDTSTVGG